MHFLSRHSTAVSLSDSQLSKEPSHPSSLTRHPACQQVLLALLPKYIQNPTVPSHLHHIFNGPHHHHLSPEFLLHPHPLLPLLSSQSHPVTTSVRSHHSPAQTLQKPLSPGPHRAKDTALTVATCVLQDPLPPIPKLTSPISLTPTRLHQPL